MKSEYIDTMKFENQVRNAKLWNILKYHYTKHLYITDQKYFGYFEMLHVTDTFKTFDVIDRIESPEILGNWNLWIIWNLCERIVIFSILRLRYF